MRRFSKSKKTIAALAVAAAVVAGSGAAYAYWTTTGTGTGTVTASTPTGITVVQTSVITNLAPGVAAQPLAGTFTNSNSGPVYIASVTAAIAVTMASGHPAGTCDATDFTLTGATMTVGHEVAVGTAATWSGATIAFNDKVGANQDACKLATVNITYSAV